MTYSSMCLYFLLRFLYQRKCTAGSSRNWCCRVQYGLTILLKQKADANLQDINGRTSLIWAAKHNHDAVVKLLDRNTAVDGQDEDGQTPLHAHRGSTASIFEATQDSRRPDKAHIGSPAFDFFSTIYSSDYSSEYSSQESQIQILGSPLAKVKCRIFLFSCLWNPQRSCLHSS